VAGREFDVARTGNGAGQVAAGCGREQPIARAGDDRRWRVDAERVDRTELRQCRDGGLERGLLRLETDASNENAMEAAS
jgi:hypothetical protein